MTNNAKKRNVDVTIEVAITVVSVDPDVRVMYSCLPQLMTQLATFQDEINELDN